LIRSFFWFGEQHMKVLIVGGGIGGFATAVALRRAGMDIELLEQAGEIRERGAGLTLWSNAMQILASWGLEDSIRDCSSTLRQGLIQDHAGKVLANIPLDKLAHEFQAPVVGIHRARLLNILASCTPAKMVHLSCRVIDFVEHDDYVEAFTADGRSFYGNILIAADGVHSLACDKLRPNSKRYCGYIGWQGICERKLLGIPADVSTWTWGLGGQFGLVPVDQERVYWFGTANFVTPPDFSAAENKREIIQRFQKWHAPIPALTKVLQPEMILRIPIFDRPPTKTWGTKRMMLLGDSAHATTPTLGHGACLAIESAHTLANALKQPIAPELALKQYAQNRQARTDKIIRTSYRLGGLIQTNSSVLARLRNLGVRYLPTAVHYRSLRNLVAPGCRFPIG
jgi:2-polyprenyl-6-methoxyphenol hydroxylase-like FAD-dependent oxidoreductase